ncbi:DsbA family oxidoreductase [Mycetocola reblochoni]|uniref:2-hydroxychromene-2-carboxylate isomerase/DsbA-like thioredoxin domain n=2 Tax=Mycetocola reblochoni TaxID=331618 RepID=A0A1R4K4X7_9MICO|nr:DsbA family oxidoreductase [Mycetocola reblochoni]RLP69883.1 DsbA family oxidoreductase [Mycetocola reblochoni]SJN39063.1 2-hydroxychromene-2-carboxylate isomerase/DsbA-like thioredoxin domain [Mycetocola reblochoni REB411]
MTDTLTVDIWSDIACPWCYIGKTRFERAVSAVSADGTVRIETRMHSYELAPDTPERFHGSETDFLVEHKGVPADQVAQMLEQVTRVAAETGLDYDFDRLQHANTRRAHELLHIAAEAGRERETLDVLFRAYFTEGRSIRTVDDLVVLAVEAGLDADAARAALDDGRFADAVSADIAQAQTIGVPGVPFFVFDGRYAVSGAQETTVFEQVIRQVLAARADGSEADDE